MKDQLNGKLNCHFPLFLKNFKKIQYLAFTEKVKIINSYVPEKVKNYIEKNLIDELKYFQKNILLKLKVLSNDEFIIPEYKIDF